MSDTCISGNKDVKKYIFNVFYILNTKNTGYPYKRKTIGTTFFLSTHVPTHQRKLIDIKNSILSCFTVSTLKTRVFFFLEGSFFVRISEKIKSR